MNETVSPDPIRPVSRRSLVQGAAWSAPVVTLAAAAPSVSASVACEGDRPFDFNTSTYTVSKSANLSTATFSWPDAFGPGTGTLEFVMNSNRISGGFHQYHMSYSSGPVSGTGHRGLGMVLYRFDGNRGASQQNGQFLLDGEPYVVQNFRFDFGDIDSNNAAERLGFTGAPYPSREQVVNRSQVSGAGRFGNGGSPWATAPTATYDVSNTSSFNGNVQITYNSVQSFDYRYDVYPPSAGTAAALTTHFIPMTFTAPCPPA